MRVDNLFEKWMKSSALQSLSRMVVWIPYNVDQLMKCHIRLSTLTTSWRVWDNNVTEGGSLSEPFIAFRMPGV